MFKFTLPAIVIAASIGLSGCTNSWYPFLYRPTFSQGNTLNPNAVNQLKAGMTKAQVLNLMGNPILDTPLSPDTWYYIYTLSEKGKITQHKKVVLYFTGDRLSGVARN
jgi:outer membrane protein assembly factor BamE